jgi:hypothetical protein
MTVPSVDGLEEQRPRCVVVVDDEDDRQLIVVG